MTETFRSPMLVSLENTLYWYLSSQPIMPSLNDAVRGFWEQAPCGTTEELIGSGAGQKYTREWYESIERYRYSMEPFIHSIAQFTRFNGKQLLEVGVGAGTDHLQWAKAGADCSGVDLTDAAIETTRRRLELYGFRSNLERIDAEKLPFPDATFDVVYSWGVIHHSERPDAIFSEIRRVLRPNGVFIGMMYGRRSPVVFKLWIRYGCLAMKPWRSFREVVWHHVESLGTKAYTEKELMVLLKDFSQVDLIPTITPYDKWSFPQSVSKFFPNEWGWFIGIRARK